MGEGVWTPSGGGGEHRAGAGASKNRFLAFSSLKMSSGWFGQFGFVAPSAALEEFPEAVGSSRAGRGVEKKGWVTQKPGKAGGKFVIPWGFLCLEGENEGKKGFVKYGVSADVRRSEGPA